MQRKSCADSTKVRNGGLDPSGPQGRLSLPRRVLGGFAAAATLVSLLSVIALSGCQGTLPPPDPPPHHGSVVRISCPDALRELVRSQSHPWQARQQARVEIVAPGEAADVWIVSPAALPALVVGGKLAPLPHVFRERGNVFEWPSLLSLYREQLLSWDGTAYAVPLAGESPICIYRADLLADARHQQQFRAFQRERYPGSPVRELRPPATWEEFARIAEYFQRHHPSGKTAPSLPPLPADDAELDRLFYTVAASARRAIHQETIDQDRRDPSFLDERFSFHYDVNTGMPRIASPAFVATLRLLQRLQLCRPAGASAHPVEAFRDGKAVLCITDAGSLLDVPRDKRDKVGICAVPGSDHYFTPDGQKKMVKEGVNRVPYLGGAGWLAAVPTAAANPSAAFDLLADLCGPARSMQIVLDPRAGGGPVRTEQVLRERWDSYDLDPEQSLALKEAVAHALLNGLENPVLCLRTPDAQQQRDVLVARVREALTSKGDPEAALKAVAQRWTALNEKKGAETHRREYRMSLGLRGK